MSSKSLPKSGDMFSDAQSNVEIAERHEALVKAMTKATVEGVSGEAFINGSHDAGAPYVTTRSKMAKAMDKQLENGGVKVSKSIASEVQDALNGQSAATMAKQWTLGNPITTGLVPFDLEAPAKLLAPRPTPLRNRIPRVKGQGAARRFKTISGFTGTGTGGIGTLQPGITESTTNVGPGGLAYIRPPYISYAGFDTVLSNVSWGLSDSVSWQAEYEGQGFEDIRSLSNTALLYSTMLMDERLMLYGRATTGNGYAGALAAPGSVTAASASVGGSLTSGVWTYVVASDAGDLLGTTGAFHQSATTAEASVTVPASGAFTVTVGTDAPGALGYNVFVASVHGGPYFYAGRSGYNKILVQSATTTTASVAASSADASAVATNFDGLLTNIAANGYTTRLNSTFSTSTPGVELQTMFSSVWDSVKADPDEAWFNGHDRNQLSNALLAGNNVNNYAIRVVEPQNANGVTIGALVQGIVNQITGKEVEFNVHPWMPQGNALIRSTTLPIPDSNVSETSVMSMVQDYAAIQWPSVQFTFDQSTIEVGTMCHYAPAWSGTISGIQQNG